MVRSLAIGVIALFPVLSFLLMLVYLDSYKLTRLRTVVAVLAAGGAVAALAYFVNGSAMRAADLDTVSYCQFVAPFVEEALKALVVLALFRAGRIGFLVDAAILGFAVGAGFAVVENTAYMAFTPDATLGTWIVRGLGTALMHGAVTSILAVLALEVSETREKPRVLSFVPCLLAAVAMHAAFNNFLLSPLLSTLMTILVLPALLLEIFQRGGKRVGKWLRSGFDADADMLGLINSGQFTESALGLYLLTLKARFDGPVVADILCYIRLHTELALRAKGLLMMRENGLEVPVDAQTTAKFQEIAYLAQNIGKTGLLAIEPMLDMSRKDLWQLNVLGK